MRPLVYIDGKEGTTGLQIYDRLAGREDIQLLLIDEEKRKDVEERRRLMNQADLVFLCLPDQAACEAVSLVTNDHTRIIDASTAHRTAPGWVYGFPELGGGQREAIAAAKRVANPGCYATGFIALVRPLVEQGILPADAALTAHALSGYTGGGKKTIAQYEAADREPELVRPPALRRELKPQAHPGDDGRVRPDTPAHLHAHHLRFPPGHGGDGASVPRPAPGGTECREPAGGLRRLLPGGGFVKLRPADAPACGFIGSNNLAGSNELQIFVCGNDEQVMLAARLDNLVRGASGAAVQNMNLMLGFDETAGLG